MKEFFARLNPTERRFVVGVGVVFFIVLNFVFVWPHFSDWGGMRKRNNTASANLLKFEAGTNDIPKLQTEISKYRKGGGAIVPPENQAVQFLRQIQNQATLSGVQIISMGGDRQSSGTNQFFVERNQTITLSAQEGKLVNFLYSLGADSNSLIRVRDLSIQPDPPRQNLTVRATLIASYQRAAPIAPPKATPTTGTTAKPATPAPTQPTKPGPANAAPPKPAPSPATAPKAAPAAQAPNPTGAGPAGAAPGGVHPTLPRPGAPGFPGMKPGSNAPNTLTPNKK